MNGRSASGSGKGTSLFIPVRLLLEAQMLMFHVVLQMAVDAYRQLLQRNSDCVASKKIFCKRTVHWTIFYPDNSFLR
jgi:hypothetical protein